jgi:hypothetical protein
MANFTVDSITSQKRQMAEDFQEMENEKMTAKITRKTLAKETDTSLKRTQKELERQAKISEQRQALVLKSAIERRFQAFPWLQEKVPPLSGKNASIGELQDLNDLQKLELELQGAEKRLHTYITKGSFLLENIWGDGSKMTFMPQKLRLNLTDLGQIINSPIFMDKAAPLITETIIEYPTFGQMSLSMRWAECILEVLLTVNAMNNSPKIKELMKKAALQRSDSEDVEESKI